MIKQFITLGFLLFLITISHGQSMMPSTSPSITGGDEVRGRDGTTCRQGTYVGPTFDTGISITPSSSSTVGSLSSVQQSTSQLTNQATHNNNIGLYARIVIPFGKQPDRIDCSKLYSLEIERLQMEIIRLKESGSAAVQVN